MKDSKTLGLLALAFSAAAFMGVFFYLWQSGKVGKGGALTSQKTQPVGKEEPVATPGAIEEELPQALVLTVVTPQDNATVTNAKLVVSGKVTPGAAVDVNETEATVAADGSWQAVVTLERGENEIVVFASDEWGNEQEVSRTVSY